MLAMSSEDVLTALARERVEALRASLEAQERKPVRLVETHISWVLLADTLAYKLKKPVRLPFLDFTTLDARRRYCEKELRLNRRLAPSLYLDVTEVRQGPAGPCFGGDGPVLDVAVCMRRFPDGALWSEMAAINALEPRHIDSMAQRLAVFHRDAAVAPSDSVFGSATVRERVTHRLIEAMDSSADEAVAAAASDRSELRAWLVQQMQSLGPLWEARRRDGRVRECHGDLHLANALQLGDEASAFDGIEFDDELRWIDVLDDVAFLAMDLLAHGKRALACRFVNAYLEASGDYEGLPTLRFYMVCRALVRSQVKAIVRGQGMQSATGPPAAQYLALAVVLCRGTDARLAITHGLPGSGKTFVSQGLVEQAAAIRVRSDVERKRLFRLGALESSHDRVPGSIYDDATTTRTYGRLLELARVALLAGWPVIVDAAFLRRSERARFAALAAAVGAPFFIVDCRAAMQLLQQRLALRKANGDDASEADVAVLERLRDSDEPLDRSERMCAIVVDAARPVPAAALAQRWLAGEKSVV